MKLLLDTHVVLWWYGQSSRLSETAISAIKSADEVYVSSITAWELAIKSSVGRLSLPKPLEAMCKEDEFKQLPVHFSHAIEVQSLPHNHGDPFDRMLIAQAKVEDLIILTTDKKFHSYGVSTLDV